MARRKTFLRRTYEFKPVHIILIPVTLMHLSNIDDNDTLALGLFLLNLYIFHIIATHRLTFERKPNNTDGYEHKPRELEASDSSYEAPTFPPYRHW